VAPSPFAATMPLSTARNRLAVLWLVSAALLFLLLIAQSVLGHFENESQKVWSWALPTIMPTLTLMVSVLGADALRPDAPTVLVRTAFFRLAFLSSLFYLFLVIATLLVEPFTSINFPDLLQMSNLWLGPLQGLVTGALGLLFFTRRGPAGSVDRDAGRQRDATLP
jgi:hypothetical protein